MEQLSWCAPHQSSKTHVWTSCTLLFFHFSPLKLSKRAAQGRGAAGRGRAGPLRWGEDYIRAWRRREGTAKVSAEQAVVHCHQESWARKRIRRRLYNPRVKQCAQAKPVGSPVIVFTVKLPITRVPSRTCGRWSLVSVVYFTICREDCEQLRSWEVSEQKCWSLPRGENGRHAEGADVGGLTKLAGTAAGHTKVKGTPSNCLQRALSLGPGLFCLNLLFSKIKDALGEGVKCS